MTVIDRLYAAAVAPEEWPAFLASLASLLDAENAFVCKFETRLGPSEYLSLTQTKRDVLPVGRFAEVMADDPRMPYFNACADRPVHCRMAVSDHRLRGSRSYREYLGPLGIEYTMITAFPGEGALKDDIGLTRGPASRPFGDEDCALMSALVPHLKRAFQIRRALGERLPAPTAPPIALSSSDWEVLRQLLDLTPAQARLTAILARGCSLKEAALELRVTENSARQYLKQVFQRTGARRQSDLVRMVYNGLNRLNRGQ